MFLGQLAVGINIAQQADDFTSDGVHSKLIRRKEENNEDRSAMYRTFFDGWAVCGWCKRR
jgi:hypothetical protein